jgi:hypothetical protein
MKLVDVLYRTNRVVGDACEELGIEFSEELLEDLEQCTHCNIWWYSYELIPDLDENNICKFCCGHYGL